MKSQSLLDILDYLEYIPECVKAEAAMNAASEKVKLE